MKKRLYSLSTNRQEGQLMLNLAEILVSAALVVGGAFQAQVFLQDYQFESYYGELKGVESVLWDYKAQTGYWPGDCNSDGVIDISSVGAVSASGCAFDVKSKEAMTKIFSDLAGANMLDEGLKAKFVDDDGQHMQLAHDAGHSLNGRMKENNVLIAFDVSVELAQWLDKKIDGGLTAHSGRVRLWEQASKEAWPEKNEIDSVDIAYYFDSKI